QRKGLARSDLEAHLIHGARGADLHGEIRHLEQGLRCVDPPHAALPRGSKASRTTSANRLAASTSTNMKQKAETSDHHTMGSRASSMRAILIMVPKLMVVGSTPMPT